MGRDDSDLPAAWQAAAAAPGVVVRSLAELADLHRVKELFDEIWQPGPAGALVRVELLRAMTHGGNYLAGAYLDGELVGASLGFFTAPPGHGLHSHITGVAAAAQRRHVGRALKLHQRAWARDRGLRVVSWTFDPLVRRNAHFNLVTLGAGAVKYLVDFYGDIPDAINEGQGSDRLLAEWDVTRPLPPAATRGGPVAADAFLAGGAVTLLTAAPAGEPEPGPGPRGATAETVLVQVPPNIEALRSAHPDLTRRWRGAVRDTLGHRLATGGRITGFTSDGCYVIAGGG